jgi:hypothetical protein
MKRRANSRNQHSGASALVITLAFIIILTVILLAYFNIVTMDRLATRNYAQGLKAESAARGAMDFIVGQMRTEMGRGASPLSVGNYSLFTNVVSTNVRPETIGTNAAVPSLIKMAGANQGVFSNAALAAVNAPSSTQSANGRRITTGRWGRPGLGTSATSPSWFLLGPNGVTNSPSTNVESRFAFAVYDLGSLVDINVAGAPSALTAPQRQALKGTLAALDLASLGLDQAAMDDLIGNFRNRNSALNYTNYVLRVGATNGFLRVQPGDDTFLSRQDFLAYAKAKGLTNAQANFSTFTRTVNGPSWTPATNAASFNYQIVTRSNVVNWNPSSGASTSSLSSNASYQADAALGTSTNRSFLSQVVSGTFRRLDDTAAQAGEPLVATRFPLSRLGWLSKDGPSQEAKSRFGTDAEAAARIKAAFGLVWDSVNRLWVYTSPNSANGGGSFISGNSNGPASLGRAASTIKTLAVVASENREPDFFELLQAGILKGSLGQHSSIANPNGIPQPGEVTSQGHLFQIGANIIDQYDADDFPTLIRVCMPAVLDASPGAWDGATTGAYVLGTGPNGLVLHDFAGVENIPYLMSIRTRAFRPQVGNSADGARRFGQGILLPQLWNPHQNAASPSSDRPASFRIIQTFGEVRMAFMGMKRGSTQGTVYIDSLTGDPFGYMGYVTSPPSAWPSPSGRPQPMIEFSGAATFAQPGFLAPSQITATSSPENIQTALTADFRTKADVDPAGFVGFWLGGAPAPGAAYVATTPLDESSDNTAIDRQVWSYLTGQPAAACPVQQEIFSVATPVARNSAALPAGDRFWKGDTNLAINNQRWPVFELQYLDSGVWKTYQRLDGALRGGGSDHKWDTLVNTFLPAGQYAGSFVSESHAAMYGRIDPRGSRFGLVRIDDPGSLYNGTWNGNPLSYRNVPMSGALGTTGRPNGEASVNFNGSPLAGNQGGAEFTDTFNPASDSTRWLTYGIAEWANNRSPGQRYTDNDRILRRGDGNTPAGINPLAASTDARPVMLNRPFQSAGDLGYVHRDLPFRTLDFFSETSADAGLLDVFGIQETRPIVAGKLNLNGRNAAVMEQILRGAVVRETTQATLSDSNAGSVATNLVSFSSTNALTGLWQLPGFLESTAYQGAVSGDLAKMKTQAEAISRQLAAVTDTRCWNLLIDVVAQSGKYAASTTDPNQFIVEGERRYWLQIAIDRFTGKVVSQQIEPVYE